MNRIRRKHRMILNEQIVRGLPLIESLERLAFDENRFGIPNSVASALQMGQPAVGGRMAEPRIEESRDHQLGFVWRFCAITITQAIDARIDAPNHQVFRGYE